MLLIRGFTACVMITATCAAHAANQPSLPQPDGPYGVGRVSYEFTDTSRPEPLASKPGGHRRVMVQVWYPSDARSTNPRDTAPYLPGFDQASSEIGAGDIADMFRPAVYVGPQSLPRTAAIEKSPIANRGQRFPLLLFAHGWGNPTFLYTAEIQDIVSHGYIVAAVDHPYDTNYTRFPDGEVTGFGQASFDRAAKLPHGIRSYTKERVEVMTQDNRYVLTQLLDDTTMRALHAPFRQSINSEEIGAFGHSIGGLTAARTCQIDPRVRACMDQDSTDYRGSPFVGSDLQTTEAQPFFLYVVSSADVWTAKALNPSEAELAQQKLSRPEFDSIMRQQQRTQTQQLAAIAGGSYRLMLFGLPGFIHRSFTDQTLLASNGNRDESIHNFQVAQTYTLAFFGKYLKGETEPILDGSKVVDPRAKLEVFPAH